MVEEPLVLNTPQQAGEKRKRPNTNPTPLNEHIMKGSFKVGLYNLIHRFTTVTELDFPELCVCVCVWVCACVCVCVFVWVLNNKNERC